MHKPHVSLDGEQNSLLLNWEELVPRSYDMLCRSNGLARGKGLSGNQEGCLPSSRKISTGAYEG